MTTVLEGNSVCKALQLTIVRDLISGSMVQAIVNMVAKGKKLMAPVAKLAAEQAEKEVSEAALQIVLAASPLLPVSSGDSTSPENEWKILQYKKSPQGKKMVGFVRVR